ncbi:hypothetical protein COU62_03265 [Candidatus Pacearchaeota archaeon CG10_big_fil_rev_8_21_14_0_10_35_219]|nr:hypothetical protein [Candidatus Pacearchaeota archaeon]OIO42390.1 MAG: hypothetical protein AUJ63_03900 [Candidatus Pacearchaeota archaeon CG1_02_35_32]PIO07375.1 MAG: hypothetical protein COU62_03265 [Candidatus Pacearchaeota archaeon CG10_big_fil_rev_8_21_14_0_10_35_219]PIY81698.1 MAG: hypothetical protein COY79_01330 [Candidatus Pacearchaeota archaeon CG_4_10_14_0_8_um_filter_35_169]PIZ79516.1 MAG: hypothetical protein COY00_03795 [Candidatus Pacearchaeota archaeon CG_4_10_14_0_2_um_filt
MKKSYWAVIGVLIILIGGFIFSFAQVKFGPPGNEIDIEQISVERYTYNKMDTWSPGSSRIAMLGGKIFALEIREDSTSGKKLLFDLKYRNENEVWRKVPGVKFGPARTAPVMVADDEKLHIIYPEEIAGQEGCDSGGNIKHYTVSLDGTIGEIDTSGIWPLDYYVCTERYSIALHPERNQILLTIYAMQNDIPSGLVLANFNLITGEWNRGSEIPTDRDNVNAEEGTGYTSIATLGNDIYVSSTVWRSFDIGKYIYRQVDIHKSQDNGKSWEKATLCKVDEKYLDGTYTGQGCLNLDIMESKGEINVLFSADPSLGAMSSLGNLPQKGFYFASSRDNFRPHLVQSGKNYPYDIGGSLGEFDEDIFVAAPEDGQLTFWKTIDFGKNWTKLNYKESKDSERYIRAYNPMTFKKKYSSEFKKGIFGLMTDITSGNSEMIYNRLDFFELELSGLNKSNAGNSGGNVAG